MVLWLKIGVMFIYLNRVMILFFIILVVVIIKKINCFGVFIIWFCLNSIRVLYELWLGLKEMVLYFILFKVLFSL